MNAAQAVEHTIEMLQWLLIGSGLVIILGVIAGAVILFGDRCPRIGPMTWKEEQRQKGYRL